MINFREESAEIVTIGKNEAIFLLNLNTKNRKRKNTKVAEYRTIIKEGKFKFNGASIVVSKEGVLLDGQHRLMALEEIGTHSIKVVLVTGVDEDTMGTIDVGSKRTNGDFLSIEGFKNSNHIAAMSRLVLEEFGLNRRYEEGIRTRGDKQVTNKILIAYTPQETIDFVNNNIELLQDAFSFAEQIYRTGTKIKGLSVATIGAFFILLSRENKQMAKNFLREVLTGVSISSSNAGIILRNKLLDITIKKTAISAQELRDLILYSFRKYKDGLEVKRLKRESHTFLKLEDRGI